MFLLTILFFLFAINLSFAEEEDSFHKIKGKSKNVEVDLVDQSFKAKGKTFVEYKDMTVEAKDIKKVEEENRIIAKDKIIYTQGNYLVSAEYLDLDLDKREAKVKKGNTYLNKFHLSAEELDLKFPKILTAKKAMVTTCNLDEPHFHIKAEHVDFYPDSKFVAYNGWIYIGEKFRLFPVPIYASYVSEKADEDRAPLFPKIAYDEAKGSMVIYGFNYQIWENETFYGIKNINLDFLLNVELSQKRGFGINRMKTDYSLEDKKLSGEFVIKDWVKAEKESLDKSFASVASNDVNNTKLSGSSYKFETKHRLKTDRGILFKNHGEYFIGKSDAKFEYKLEDSDLIKDPKGSYIPTTTKKKFTQMEIELDQKIWKLANFQYKYKNIVSEKDTLQKLFAAHDDKASEEVISKRRDSEVDTKLSNFIKFTQQDKYHEIKYERKRDRDLKPEIGSSGKSKFDNRDLYSIELKYFKAKVTKEDISKDKWSKRSSYFFNDRNNEKRFNYISSEEVKDLLKIELGKYYLANTKFNIYFSSEYLKKEEIKFGETNLVYKSDPTKQAEHEYKNRSSNIIDSENSDYYKHISKLKHDGLELLNLDRQALKVIPSYEVEAYKYLSNSGKLNGVNEYIDALLQKFSYEIPFTLYDNSGDIGRNADILLSFTPKSTRSFFNGDFPSEQTPPDVSKVYNNKTILEIGNIKNTYIFNLERIVHPTKNYEKDFKIRHEGTIKVENLNFFTFRITNNSKRVTKNIINDLDRYFSQEYKLDFGDINIGIKQNIDKTFERDKDDKDTVKRDVLKNIWNFSLGIYGMTSSYKLSKNTVNDLIKNSLDSDSIENKITLKYEKEFKEVNRKYKISGDYLNSYDKAKDEYKDSTVSISFSLEDRNEIVAEEKRLYDERREKMIEEDEEDLSYEIKERESDFVDDYSITTGFVESKKIDKILEGIEYREKKPRKTIMDLGKEDKKETLNKRLKKYSIDLEVVNDSGVFHSQGKNWNSYKNSWKKIILKFFFKYSTLLEAEYNILKRKDNVADPYIKDEREIKVKLGLGQKDYEWEPGFYLKQNWKTDKIESIYGTLEHNIHCTKIGFKLGKSKDSKDDLVWMFGFEFSINEFPEKSVGADIRSDRVENVKFGI